MKLKREMCLTIHLGGFTKSLFVLEGTEFKRDEVRGEVVFRITSGPHAGWFLVASEEWVRKNMEVSDGTQRSSRGSAGS